MSSWTRAAVDQLADETGEKLLIVDEMDDAIVGVVSHFGANGTHMSVLYDREKCIEILAAGFREEGRGLSWFLEEDPSERICEMAEEYFEFNIAGAYVGPNSPSFTVALPL